jgi:hypothetical protein
VRGQKRCAQARNSDQKDDAAAERGSLDLWVKILVIALLAAALYREIIATAAKQSRRPLPRSGAGFMSLVMVGGAVGVFTYAGMTVTRIETRDLRAYAPEHSSRFVSIFDKGVIELNGMLIKTNLAEPGELSALAERLTEQCHGEQGCEVQSMFDYVTHIPYRTDYTSRNAREVVRTGWGDCDDKSNLFASLLNEKGIDYRFVYVPHHVFVVVHLSDTAGLPFLRAKLVIAGKEYYYAETTAAGASIGEFNGQFPASFEGVYDIRNNRAVDPDAVSFGIG